MNLFPSMYVTEVRCASICLQSSFTHDLDGDLTSIDSIFDASLVHPSSVSNFVAFSIRPTLSLCASSKIETVSKALVISALVFISSLRLFVSTLHRYASFP